MIFIWDTTRPEGLTSVSSDDTIGVALTAGTATVLFDEDIVLLDASRVLFVNDLDESSYKGAVAVLGGNGNSPTLNIDYTGLSFGTKYRIQVKPGAISDVATNSLLSNFTARFTTIIDTIAPVVNSLSAGSITTTGATLLVTTDESATCRYATTDSEYATMTAFDAPNTGTSHTAVLTGLAPSTGYDFYVRCADTTAQTNTMTTSAHVSFTTVTVADTTPPVITLLGMNPVTLTVGDVYTELGATASDNVDGNITSNLAIDDSDVNMAVAGTYIVTYDISDSAIVPNAAVQEKRYVIVVEADVTPITPTVVLNGTAIVSAYTVTEATARFVSGLQFDTTDAASVTVNGSSVTPAATITAATQAEATTLGAHAYNVVVTSSTGVTANVTVAYQVNADPVSDTTPPVIILLGVNPQTFTVGDAYTELGAAASDDVDGDITSNLVIDASAINMAVAGTYTVTYNVSDAEGNDATEETRTVIVNAAFDDTAILAV